MSKSKEKTDLKELMKKMIDEMSETEMNKMLRESGDGRKFNMDLEQNLRIKNFKEEIEMSSNSSVNTKSIEMP